MRLCPRPSLRRRTLALANSSSSVRSVEIGSPTSLNPWTASARRKVRNTGDVTAERFVLDNPTLPQLFGGSVKAVEKMLIEISLGIRRYDGPEEASGLDEALQRIMSGVVSQDVACILFLM